MMDSTGDEAQRRAETSAKSFFRERIFALQEGKQSSAFKHSTPHPSTLHTSHSSARDLTDRIRAAIADLGRKLSPLNITPPHTQEDGDSEDERLPSPPVSPILPPSPVKRAWTSNTMPTIGEDETDAGVAMEMYELRKAVAENGPLDISDPSDADEVAEGDICGVFVMRDTAPKRSAPRFSRFHSFSSDPRENEDIPKPAPILKTERAQQRVLRRCVSFSVSDACIPATWKPADGSEDPVASSSSESQPSPHTPSIPPATVIALPPPSMGLRPAPQPSRRPIKRPLRRSISDGESCRPQRGMGGMVSVIESAYANCAALSTTLPEEQEQERAVAEEVRNYGWRASTRTRSHSHDSSPAESHRSGVPEPKATRSPNRYSPARYSSSGHASRPHSRSVRPLEQHRDSVFVAQDRKSRSTSPAMVAHMAHTRSPNRRGLQSSLLRSPHREMTAPPSPHSSPGSSPSRSPLPPPLTRPPSFPRSLSLAEMAPPLSPPPEAPRTSMRLSLANTSTQLNTSDPKFYAMKMKMKIAKQGSWAETPKTAGANQRGLSLVERPRSKSFSGGDTAELDAALRAVEKTLAPGDGHPTNKKTNAQRLEAIKLRRKEWEQSLEKISRNMSRDLTGLRRRMSSADEP